MPALNGLNETLGLHWDRKSDEIYMKAVQSAIIATLDGFHVYRLMRNERLEERLNSNCWDSKQHTQRIKQFLLEMLKTELGILLGVPGWAYLFVRIFYILESWAYFLCA